MIGSTCRRAVLAMALLAAMAWLPSAAARADDLYVSNGNGTASIGKYTRSGATIDASLVETGLPGPRGFAVSGSDLYVASFASTASPTGTIGKYTTSGATVNSAL